MTKAEIMEQLDMLVDGYLESNEEEADGEPDTADFIVATYISFETLWGDYLTSVPSWQEKVNATVFRKRSS